MIKKLKKIKNLGSDKGLSFDYTWDSSLPDFERYNVFYGYNGSGKTMLSKLFACLKTGNSSEFPDLKYEIEDENSTFNENSLYNQEIRVFNQDYIQKNVHLISGTANPIVILGKENKEIDDRIKTNEKSLEGFESQKKAKEAEKKSAKRIKDNKFTDVAGTIGVSLFGSPSRYYQKPNAEKDFKEITEKRILSQEEFERQQMVITQKQEEEIEKIEVNSDLDLNSTYKEVTGICQETVEINVINRLTENPDISKWVEQGLEFHTLESTQCEFCGSNLPRDRIKELLGHFNEADKKLKEKIDEKNSDLQQKIEKSRSFQLPDMARFYTDLRESFTPLETIYNQEKKNYCDALSAMVETLNTKKQKTTEKISFEGSSDNGFQSALNRVNNLIDQHNQKSDNFKKEKKKVSESIKNHHLSQIYDPVKTLDTEIGKCGKEIQKLEDDIEELKTKIAEDKNKISSEHIACNTLNEKLHIFLGRKEINFEVSPEGGYVLKRNGNVAQNLSEGEKTAIAFVYFIVHLQDQDFDRKNGIIVVDDPISSLDSNSLYQAFSFLQTEVKDAKQVFVFTHNFNFLKLILRWLKHHKKSSQFYMIKNECKDKRIAFISELEKELKNYHSEYHYLFKVLYEFKSNGSIAQAYPIPNMARKLLDTFLMFMVPNDESPYKKLLGSDSPIDFDETKKRAIYNFTNDQSHITGDGLDPSLVQETQKNVQYLLEMIEKVSPKTQENVRHLLEMIEKVSPAHYRIIEEEVSNQSSS